MDPLLKVIIGIVILGALWLICSSIVYKDNYAAQPLSDYVHRPISCNVLPFRPGVCDPKCARMSGYFHDSNGYKHTRINLHDTYNLYQLDV